MLTLRTGFEIELLAPAGSDRQVLAEALAVRHGGEARRSFHTDSDPAVVPGAGTFRTLSPAFDVTDAGGRPVVRLVDDITIEAFQLAARTPAGHRGWYRILCDDGRLLRLVERHADPSAPLAAVLQPAADLFGTSVELVGGSARVDDASGASVAVAMPLPSGRERPTEIITPPLAEDHEAALAALLGPARELGFTVPLEAAVHLHVDGGPFRTAPAFGNLVRLFGHWREALWTALETNPACRRLAPLPAELVRIVDAEPGLGWSELQAVARSVGLTKYADVNLTQLVASRPVRATVEVRILPGDDDAAAIVRRAALVEGLLLRCLDPRPIPRPGPGVSGETVAALLDLAGVAA